MIETDFVSMNHDLLVECRKRLGCGILFTQICHKQLKLSGCSITIIFQPVKDYNGFNEDKSIGLIDFESENLTGKLSYIIVFDAHLIHKGQRAFYFMFFEDILAHVGLSFVEKIIFY